MTCDPTVECERLVGRGSSPDDVARRVSAQGGWSERVGSAATVVLDTSGEPSEPRAGVEGTFDDALRPRGGVPPG